MEQKPSLKLSELPSDISERINTVYEKSGFIPNVFVRLAARPDEFRAFFSYHDALMEKKSGLSKSDREMIVVATSAKNNCTYCVIAHGAVLRIRSKNRLLADQVAVNYLAADITAKQRAMLDFALKVAESSHLISKNDSQTLKEFGFSDNDIWDIVAITAFFGMSNRLANSLFIEPNEEFYEMGR